MNSDLLEYNCFKCGLHQVASKAISRFENPVPPTVICKYCEREVCLDCLELHGCSGD